jgi:uncharacterized protein (DUF1499 family)
MARWSFLLGSLGLLAYAVGPLLANLRLSPPIIAFDIFLAGTALGVLGLVLGIVSVVRNGIGTQNPLGLAGLGLCALLVLPVAGMVLRARRFPAINDITTDTASPPQFTQTARQPENKAINFNYPGDSFARQQQTGYPDLKPLHVNLALADTFDLALAAAKEDKLWHVTVIDGLGLTLEGYEESQMFRFRDDFVVEVRQAPAGYAGSLVEMRSRSRDGRGDLGVNAARIKRFLDAVHAKSLHANSVAI